MSSQHRERRASDLIIAVLIALAGMAVVEATLWVQRPARGLTDTGVVTTRPAITPAPPDQRPGPAHPSGLAERAASRIDPPRALRTD
jgi:hypothetical protein